MMAKGQIVKPKNITGAVKYKFDNLENKLIVFAFTHQPNKLDRGYWASANIFHSDIISTEWEVWNAPKEN